MKPEDREYLDCYARLLESLPPPVASSEAMRTPQLAKLAAAYEGAWATWDASADAASWDSTIGDAL